MITVTTGPDASVPVRLLRWTADGRVKIRRDRIAAGFIIFGDFWPVEIFMLQHALGREALAKALAALPGPQS